MIKRDAIQPGEGFNPATGQTVRLDKGMKRLVRGYMKEWPINTWNLIFFLGALVTAGLVSLLFATIFIPLWSKSVSIVLIFPRGAILPLKDLFQLSRPDQAPALAASIDRFLWDE
jgi:hypothetical protein